MNYLATDYLGLPPSASYMNLSQPSPSFPEDRQMRWNKIAPLVKAIRDGVIPSIKKEDIPELLETLKEEGNAFYRDKNFFYAYDIYTSAIYIIMYWKQWISLNVDEKLASTLFSNRAACLLKMDYFKACIDDCNVAMTLNNRNLKAHYRKAQALKMLADYAGAKASAESGRKQAEEECKATDVKEFDELLREICCHRGSEASLVQPMKGIDIKNIPMEHVLSEDRRKWWDCFEYVRSIVWDRSAAASLDIDADFLCKLMKEMANEAGSLLEERNYHIASELFSGVLVLAKRLQADHFKETNRSFLSETFLKRAICAQKMDFFDKALEDCDLSLHLDQNNDMNILYQKALIFKAKKCFREAFIAAVACRHKALERNDSNIVKLCDVVICESDSHCLNLEKKVVSTGSNVPMTVSPEPAAEDKHDTIDQNTKAKRKKRWKKKNSAVKQNINSDGRDGNEVTASDDGGHKETGDTEFEVLYKRNEVNDDGVTMGLESVMGDKFDSVMSSDSVSLKSTPPVIRGKIISTTASEMNEFDSIIQPSKSTFSIPSKSNASTQRNDLPTDSGIAFSVGELHDPLIVEPDSKSADKLSVSPAGKSSPTPAGTAKSTSLSTQKAKLDYPYPFTTLGVVSPKQAAKSTVPKSVAGKQSDCSVPKTVSDHISKATVPKAVSGSTSEPLVSKKTAAVKSEPQILNDVERAVFGLSGATSGTPVADKNVASELSISKKSKLKTSNSNPPSSSEVIKANMEPVAIKAPVKSALLSLTELSLKPQRPKDKAPGSNLAAVRPIEPCQNSALVGPSSIAARKKQEKKTTVQESTHAVMPTSNAPSGINGRAVCPLPAPAFPFGSRFAFRLACSVCFKENAAPLSVDHRCREDILVIQSKKTQQWLVVRECKHQIRRGGCYMMCWHASLDSKCPRGVSCTFAHNIEELKLWNLQKEGFRIDEFIAGNRSAGSPSAYSVETVFRKYDGQLRMICGSCFKEQNRIFTQNLRDKKCDIGAHELLLSKLLAHRARDLRVTMIGKRPLTGKNACFRLCYQGQFCRKKVGCICAHSEIERDIWYLERDTGLNQDVIVIEWHKLSIGSSNSQSSGGSTPGRSTPVSSAPTNRTCPYKIAKVCSFCLKNGSVTENTRGNSKCTNGHSWNLSAVFMILLTKKVAKELPRQLPLNENFKICKFVSDCHLGNSCQFAHSSEEIQIWIWMIENRVKKLDDLIVKQLKETSVKKRSSSLTTLVDRRPSSSSPPWAISSQATISPFLGQEQSFYCYYCGIPCNSQAQLEVHCSSPKHNSNVNSDKDKQWNFHQPPWNVQNGSYCLCTRHLEGRCRFSNVPASSNMCTFAHSQEELDEWIERYKWRSMKRKLAVDENLFSYMDRLLKEFNESGDSVLSEEVRGVSVLCSDSLSLFAETKNAEKQWTFYLNSPGLTLKKVALLHHDSRLHFDLENAKEKSCQLAQGDAFRVKDHVYSVDVYFKGGIYGSFSQSVVFDFGSRPLLFQKISVELGRQGLRQKVEGLRENLHLDRWTPSNKTIVKFPNTSRVIDEFNERILTEYKPPSSAEIMQQVIGFELNQHNYKFKLHGLLNLEEMTQTRIISGYNVIAKVQVKNCVGDEMKGFRFAQQGELYAQVPLTSQLIEGSLVSTSVVKVLVAPKGNQTKLVYEAIITELENQMLRGYDYVFLTLSAQCCKDFALKSGDEREMEVQFQIDRSTFCRLHYAVDQLGDVRLVFPDIPKLHLTFGQEYKMDYSSSKLNEDQMKIIAYVSTRKQKFPPPLVVYGPFGTGKTETLAEASTILAANNSNAVRILICTLTNQAADEYILRHFDPSMSRPSHRPFKVLRIYDKMRKVATVDVVARKYSLLSSDATSFKEPTKEDVLGCQVVVTTLLTSLVISQLNLRGYFSHIFVDEAAQVNECRTLVPLCLADDKTCIVLAGDHIQMVDPVYSNEAKEQNFHLSLVERLMNMYNGTSNFQSPPKVLLKVNYRNHPEIVRFVAKVFYAGEDSLVAKNAQPGLAEFPPLAFFAAIGDEGRSPSSTSFYNEAETMEVVEQVNRVYKKWPKEWGERRPDQILVTSPYDDQIRQIRSLLRRQPNRELQSVNVLRVQNVPGREFRVVVISTVRTRNILTSENLTKLPDDADYGFLSDCKMLNSAFTRAKSYLAVVGDPVALCSIGTCSKIWHQYFKFCSLQPGGINPSDLTLDTIRMQCETFVAPLEITTRSKRNDRNAKTKKENEEQFDVSEILDLEDWNRDYHLEPDEIIRQLVTQEMQQSQGDRLEGNWPQNEMIRTENIRLQEREGHALLYYREPERQRTLTSATSCEDDYDSLSDEDNEAGSVNTDQAPVALKALIKTQPQKYKRCTINIESSKNIFARPLDEPFDFKQVKIMSRRLCGHAFSGDEVVVEILRVGVAHGKKTDEKVAYGQVIGIFKQFMNPQYRLFVCTVEEGNTGIMVPINKGIPKIYNLESKSRRKHLPNEVKVYQFMNGREIRFDRFEKVNQYDTASKLFIVRFIKWDPKFPYPLGIVVKVIPPGKMVSDAMPIVEIEHSIPRRFRTETEQEIQHLFPPNYGFPNAVLKNRLDYRKNLVFTIDPAESTDLDDALSFEELSSGCYVVGVHIADVSYFLNQGRKIDEEARQRGSTFYPAAGEAIHMLPPRLSSDLCSLLPDQDKLTMSVFMTIDDAAEIKDVEVKRCVIRSQFRLNYEQVETVVKGEMPRSDPEITHELKVKILLLNSIAQEWRRRRIGNLSLHHSIEPEYLQSAQAHLLIEEFMIAANRQIAQLLVKRFPQQTPLRNQLPPNEIELDEWRQRFRKEAKNSVALTWPFVPRGSVCNCASDCTHVPGGRNDNEKFELTECIWKDILAAGADGNTELLRTLVVSPEYHPQLSVALLYLHYLSEKSQYVCSGEIPANEQSHFSLNLPIYTHFTSPIRRYSDVLVHRLLGCLIDGRQSEYSSAKMAELCLQCTDACRRSKRFEEASRLAHICQLLQQKPIVVSPVIEKIDDSFIGLYCPTLCHLFSRRLKVRLAWLQPSAKPCFEADKYETLVKWSQRIYDPLHKKSEDGSNHASNVILNPDRYIVKANSERWRKLLASVASPNVDMNQIEKMLLKESMVDSLNTQQEQDLCSEELLIKFANHFSVFSVMFRQSGIVRVQLSVELTNGLLLPSVQLLSLTKSFSICIEHRKNPVACFASTNARKATRSVYGDVEEYQELWLPVLAIEAAHSAVLNDVPATIRNVQIDWQEGWTAQRTRSYVGIFKLGVRFCSERGVRFPLSWRIVDEDAISFEDEESCSGYFCVRYADIQLKTPNTELNLLGVREIDEPYTWVGHCSMVRSSVDEDKAVVTVQLRLNSNNSPLPTVLLLRQSVYLATVEWISKPLPDWRMETAVTRLHEAEKLAQCIALGRMPDPLDRSYLQVVMPWLDKEVPGLQPANITQRNGIKQALQESFFLIQGPPGTGKTIVAVHLAYIFHQINNKLPESYLNKSQVRPQVMCCGPSNKSVDVIAGHLMRLKSPDMIIIRVYSEKVGKEDFPIPRRVLLIKKKFRLEDRVHDAALREISLHHMIRVDRWNPTSARCLREMDERIRNDPNSVTEEEIAEYVSTITDAESALLKQAHVILLTCSSSAAPRFRTAGINVRQLIIDECGMCMEPESLIPIVSSRAKQVILLGDHQQLQPIVLEQGARRRGLGQSMFERYAKNAHMLTTQYRMHESIADFPSRQFYMGRLGVGKAEQSTASRLSFWPVGGAKPIAFVHTEGRENALAVDSEEGGEQSKLNEEEVSNVVFIVTQMVEVHRIEAKSIAVLSQYRAQSTELSKKFQNRTKLKDVTVQTVVAAQGSEWDYVLLSTVRSLPQIEIERRPSINWKRKHLGFVADPHQINVAITRARKGFIIVGNRYLLESDDMWKALIKHYEENRKLVDFKTFRSLLGRTM